MCPSFSVSMPSTGSSTIRFVLLKATILDIDWQDEPQSPIQL